MNVKCQTFLLVWEQSQWNIQLPPCLLALDCPADWKEFEDSCYKVVNKFSYSRKFVWSTASRVCPGFGGDLVSISNEREMGFVYNLSSPFRSTPVWIGLAYRFQKGEYLWSNGGSFNSSVSGKWLGEISRNVGKPNAPKYWEMVGILPTVAKRIKTSFVRGPKVSCASIESNDRSARLNLYLWVKFICRFFITLLKC